MSPARGRAAALLVAALASAGAAAGCGSSPSTARAPAPTSASPVAKAAPGAADAPSAASATSTPPATPAPRSPGTVAVEYTTALFGGRFARARADVAPESRNALKVVALGLRSTSVRAKHLRAGSTTIHGDEAGVVLTGTLCSSHTDSRSARSDGEDCITNRDRHSTSPIFGVALQRGASGAWQVIYRLPG